MKLKLLLGNITFHHFTEDELALFKTNKEQKALIHEVDEVLYFDSLKDAYEVADNTNAPSWLIPSEFEGEIVYET